KPGARTGLKESRAHDKLSGKSRSQSPAPRGKSPVPARGKTGDVIRGKSPNRGGGNTRDAARGKSSVHTRGAPAVPSRDGASAAVANPHERAMAPAHAAGADSAGDRGARDRSRLNRARPVQAQLFAGEEVASSRQPETRGASGRRLKRARTAYPIAEMDA